MLIIDSFSGKYEFLSNFSYNGFRHPCDNTIFFLTNEHFYQSMKTNVLEEKYRIIRSATPLDAKRLGRTATLREDWEDVKTKVMFEGCLLKFISSPIITMKLKKTGDAILIEGNTWHDNIWGDCSCSKCESIPGQNLLGLTLMKVRDVINLMELKL